MVVEQLSGGELLDLVSDDENRQRMLLPGPEDAVGEGFIRRIYSELTKGVGWLHEVGVVHRDIKLESE
jgi:tRNA (cytidine32/guanosine34-2'-O)-methyltransferase